MVCLQEIFVGVTSGLLHERADFVFQCLQCYLDISEELLGPVRVFGMGGVIFVFAMSAIDTALIFSFRVHPYLIKVHCKYIKENAALILEHNGTHIRATK